MRTLILGGTRSGKSQLAESMLIGPGMVDYIATGDPASAHDPDWAERVRQHQARRPAAWHTIETRDLVAVLVNAGGPPILIECISTWLAAIMDDVGLWTAAADADAALTTRIDGLTLAWATSKRRAIAVSSEVGLGVVPSTESGRRYRDELGRLNMRLAAAADEVYLVVAGLAQQLK